MCRNVKFKIVVEYETNRRVIENDRMVYSLFQSSMLPSHLQTAEDAKRLFEDKMNDVKYEYKSIVPFTYKFRFNRKYETYADVNQFFSYPEARRNHLKLFPGTILSVAMKYFAIAKMLNAGPSNEQFRGLCKSCTAKT